jgi:hypothetical protein
MPISTAGQRDSPAVVLGRELADASSLVARATTESGSTARMQAGVSRAPHGGATRFRHGWHGNAALIAA